MNKIDVQQVDTNNVATRSDALTPLQIYQQRVASGEIERAKQKSLKEKWEGDTDTLVEEFSFSEFFYSENFDRLIFEKRKELDELEYLLDNKKIVLKQYVQVDVR